MKPLALCLIACLAQDAPDAGKLAAKMQDSLVKAKSVQFSFAIDLEGDTDRELGGKVEGTVYLAQGNRMRLEITLPKGRVVFISDGARMGSSVASATDTPPSLNTNFVKAVCQGGVMLGALAWINRPDQLSEDRGAGVSWSGFKLGARKEGAQAVDFQITRDGQEDGIEATVWIDEKSGLPRKLAIPDSGQAEIGRHLKITETFSNVKLDEKVDEEKFKLPR